jgi:hypothetical protein
MLSWRTAKENLSEEELKDILKVEMFFVYQHQ